MYLEERIFKMTESFDSRIAENERIFKENIVIEKSFSERIIASKD